MKPHVSRSLLRACLLALPAVLVWPAAILRAGDGTWTTDGNGTWSLADTGFWQDSVVANGEDATAYFNAIDITGNRTINLTESLTIGNLAFGDATTATNDWSFSSSNGSILTLQTTAGTPTITVDNRTTTIGVALDGDQGLTKNGTGKLVLTGGHLFTGTLTVNAGTLDLRDQSTAYSNTINLASSSSVLDAAHTASNSVITVTGNITGSGKISKTSGVSTLILTGDNDYTGGTTLAAGTILIGTGLNNGIGTGTLNLSNGAFGATDNDSRSISNALAMGSGGLRLGALEGAATGKGDLNFTWTGSTSIGGGKTWTVNNDTTATFNNNWTGNNGWSITKAGTGTLVFNGGITATNTIGINVTAGTLILNGTNKNNAAATVNGGALFVNGSLLSSQTVTVNSGGRLGGTGSVGAVTFNAGASLAYEIASAGQSAGLTTTAFSGDGIGNFTIYLSGDAAGFDDTQNYSWTVLTSNTTDIGSISLTGITIDTTGFGKAFTGAFSVAKDGDSLLVNYTAVPEPATYALLAGGALLAFACRRRRLAARSE